jgi:RNA polymerase sigma factor (sigma-70 family)
MEDPRDVLSRAAAGDESAWRDIVRRYQRLVYATIRTFRVPMDDAEDIFQEAFIRLHRHAAQVQDARALARWLIVTTRHLCIDHIARKRSAKRMAAALPPPVVEIHSEEIAHLELAHEIRESLEDLPPRCRELLALLYFEQASPDYQEASRRFQMPLGSIGPTRARCLERLMRRLRLGRARENS